VTIETGSLTAIFALANVMLFLVFPVRSISLRTIPWAELLYSSQPCKGVLPFSKVIGRLPVASNSREPKRAKDAEQGWTENSPQTLLTNQNTYHHHQEIQSSMIYHTSYEKVLKTPPPMPLKVHVRQVVQLDTGSRNQY
jgi:hypothetical protein